jgi:hypothetical protein
MAELEPHHDKVFVPVEENKLLELEEFYLLNAEWFDEQGDSARRHDNMNIVAHCRDIAKEIAREESPED